MGPQEAYVELIRHARELSLLGSASSLLGWDEQTFMPEEGAGHRSAQMGLLAGLHHERATDPRVAELLASVEGSELVAEPRSPAAVNVREIRRSYDRRVRLPRTLVEELGAQRRSLNPSGSLLAQRTNLNVFVHGWTKSSNSNEMSPPA